VIAALYVDPRGAYAGLPDVDLWDEARDARSYRGPHAVVAHPPCSRWCRLAGLVEARWGHRRRMVVLRRARAIWASREERHLALRVRSVCAAKSPMGTNSRRREQGPGFVVWQSSKEW
jgi:hypothetical protein